MSKEIGLPKGWEIKINALTGRACFFDTVNQTSHAALPDFKRGAPKEHCENIARGRSMVPARAGVPETSPRTPLVQPATFVDTKPTLPRIPPSNGTTLTTATALTRWSRHLDFATGRPYYVDHARNHCQWKVPKGFIEIKSNGTTILALRWERRYSPEGRAYYVDHLNRRSQYAIPAGFVEPETTVRRRFYPRAAVAPMGDYTRLNSHEHDHAASPQQQRSPRRKHIIPYPLASVSSRA
jgi:hypothetical protein